MACDARAGDGARLRHGVAGARRVFKGKDHIRNLQAYWRDFYQQAKAFRKQGVPPEEAAKQMDLTKHAGADSRREESGRRFRGVDRIYDLAAESERARAIKRKLWLLASEARGLLAGQKSGAGSPSLSRAISIGPPTDGRVTIVTLDVDWRPARV